MGKIMLENISLFSPDYTPVFLFFLVLLVEAGIPIPIPYDILILFSGYQELPLVPILTAVVLGNIIGSSILYTIAYRFGGTLEAKALKFFQVPERQARIAENWFRKWGKFAIIIARLAPGARFAITFLAGSLRLPYLRVFLPYLTVGSIVWVVFYWNAGALVGDSIHYLVQFISAWLLLLPLSLLVVFAYMVYIYKTKPKK